MCAVERERERHAESSLLDFNLSRALKQVFLGNDAVLWSLLSLQVCDGEGFDEQVLRSTADPGELHKLNTALDLVAATCVGCTSIRQRQHFVLIQREQVNIPQERWD